MLDVEKREDRVLGAVSAVLLDVFVTKNREGVQDVVRVGAGAAVQVEEGSIEFAT